MVSSYVNALTLEGLWTDKLPHSPGAPWMAVLLQRVFGSGIPLGFLNEEKKNLNCVELLYLLLFLKINV